MAETASLAESAVPIGSDAVASSPLGVIWRDIARGGLSGLLVGIVVGGIGGRVAMRLIALLVPGSTGFFTENGNRIGDITLGGSFAVVFFAGLFVGIFVGTIWVVVSPWLPRTLGLRVLAAIALAIGLGAFGAIEGTNSDFFVLGFDPRVVAVLLGLVGLVGASVAVVDSWLDRRLPPARSSTSPASGAYIAISAIGALFAVGVVATYLDAPLRPVGIALVVVGLATVRWWFLRARGAVHPPARLMIIARVALVVATVAGFVTVAPDIVEALGAA